MSDKRNEEVLNRAMDRLLARHEERTGETVDMSSEAGQAITAFIEDQKRKIANGFNTLSEQAIIPAALLTHKVHSEPRWVEIHEREGHQVAVEMLQLELITANLAIHFGEEVVAAWLHGLSHYIAEGHLHLPDNEEMELLLADDVPDDLSDLLEGGTDGQN